MGECYGTGSNSISYLVPGAMVDNRGDLYMAVEYSFWGLGYCIRLQKRNHTNNAGSGNEFYLWQQVFSDCTFREQNYPQLVQDNSSYLDEFKKHVHNVFQLSYIQELDGVDSDYVYLVSYMPPARYYYNYAGMLDKPEREGIFLLKIKKSDLSVVDKKLYSAADSSIVAYNRTPCITNTFDYPKLNLQEGNYHGFFDGEYIWIFFLSAQEANGIQNQLWYLKFRVSDLSYKGSGVWNEKYDTGGMQIIPRFQKLDNRFYFDTILNGFYYRLRWKSLSDSFSLWEKSSNSYPLVFPSRWLVTLSEGASGHTTFHSDFCIIKSDSGIPIWCMLCFNSQAYLTNCTSEHYWTSTYISWAPNYTSLCLSSYPMNDSTFLYPVSEEHPDTDTAVIYPSDTLYSTNLQQNNDSIATVKNGSKSDLYRLYLNTHKFVPYTSPSDKRYFIFAYCYPGKKTHLYLGYCTYRIDSSNFVHLRTQTVLKSPDTAENWGDSFSAFTDCSRIISLDIKDGEIWITWMSANDAIYYFFHIKASDLIQE